MEGCLISKVGECFMRRAEWQIRFMILYREGMDVFDVDGPVRVLLEMLVFLREVSCVAFAKRDAVARRELRRPSGTTRLLNKLHDLCLVSCLVCNLLSDCEDPQIPTGRLCVLPRYARSIIWPIIGEYLSLATS